ncbi:hypothetical protein V6B16_10715 [Salinimicrobium catena]|uniref:hypothetical protein n=1 Tax=Salinimicrobium catena TaxID=390640 RepID=UPI002FE4AEAD
MKTLPLVNLLLLLGILTYLIFFSQEQQTQDVIPELSVNRLNVVGENGNKYVVISSPEIQALGTINGKTIDPETTERPVPGLLFFNQEGDEIGGLVFGIDSTNSYQMLTFDQRKNDQIMTLRKEEQKIDGEWKKRYGLLLQERSEKPLPEIVSEIRAIEKIGDTAIRTQKFREFYSNEEHLAPRRMFLGRTFNGDVGLFLMDRNNQPRVKIYVDPEGNPKIEKIDSIGVKKEL